MNMPLHPTKWWAHTMFESKDHVLPPKNRSCERIPQIFAHTTANSQLVRPFFAAGICYAMLGPHTSRHRDSQGSRAGSLMVI